MLNDQEVAHLLGDGRALWLRVEAFGIAYHDRYKSKAILSNYLSYATIFSGICTAISTIPEFQQYNFTMVPAVITAATAVISQALSPEKAQRESWDTWKQIESLKSDLASRCRGLYLAVDYAEEQTVFQNFDRHLGNLTASDIAVTPSHRQAAEKNLIVSSISPIQPNEIDVQRVDEDALVEQTVSHDADIREFTRRVVEE